VAAQPPVIGIFDSGVGGLSVWQAIRRLLPTVPLLYLADTAYFPYGTRRADEVAARARRVATALTDQGATLLVAACNTIGSAVLTELRATTGLPVVGTVPAIRPAAALTRTGHVAALVTPVTAAGAGYRALLANAPPGVRVWTCACPGLAECVEAGDLAGPQPRGILAHALAEPLAAGADAIVLGCTHYAFLDSTIFALAPPPVAVLDGAAGVARQVARLLDQPPGEPRTACAVRTRCFATGDATAFSAVATRLLGAEATALGTVAPIELASSP
jgi:glutamate racemase